MLKASKLALTAARNVILPYKNQNKQLFQEYKEAYTRIKLTVKNGYIFEYAYNDNNCSFVLYFIDINGNSFKLVFEEYTEIRVAQAFRNAYTAARLLNSLCF